MTQRFYVIGSNSFSGASFVDFLLSQGHEVWGCSRSDDIHPVYLPQNTNPNFKKFKFLKRDLNHDTAKIISDLNEFQPQFVVNFAAQGMVAESWQRPEDWYETNFVGNVKLHNGLRTLPFIKKYVHVSTPEVYGTCTGLIDEQTVFNPSTPYAVSRAACDMSLKIFLNQYKFPVVWTRAANVYGAHQQLYRIVPKTMLSILLGKKLPLHGGGASVRSFIHIEDVARATLAIAQEAQPGETFHISTPHNISIRELVEKICKLMNVNFEKVVEVVGDRPGKDSAYLLNSAKLRKTFGWTDEISLDAGLKSTLSWIERNLELLKTLPQNYEHKI